MSTEKAYCCGNSAQREAVKIAKFDMVVSTLVLINFTILTAIIASSPDFMAQAKTTVRTEANSTDFHNFIQLPDPAQGGILSFVMLAFISGITLAILLLMGARKRSHNLLLIWFMASIVLFAVETILTIVWIVYTPEKAYWSILLITAILYKWYCLWIVKVLMREIRTVAECYGNPLDSIEPDGSNCQELDKF